MRFLPLSSLLGVWLNQYKHRMVKSEDTNIVSHKCCYQLLINMQKNSWVRDNLPLLWDSAVLFSHISHLMRTVSIALLPLGWWLYWHVSPDYSSEDRMQLKRHMNCRAAIFALCRYWWRRSCFKTERYVSEQRENRVILREGKWVQTDISGQQPLWKKWMSNRERFHLW